MYTGILKTINKVINKNYTKVKFESNNILINILINIHSLVFIIRYQRVYINTCWYEEVHEEVQLRNIK